MITHLMKRVELFATLHRSPQLLRSAEYTQMVRSPS